jgi:hypothetical protein
MLYEFAYSVAANTAKADADEYHLQLTTGIVYRVEVQFPNGCAGLTHCQLEHDGASFIPTNPSGSLASDGHAINIDEEYELTEGRTIITAILWNDDDTFYHTIYIRINILRGEAAIWFLKILRGIEKMLKLVGINV